MADSPRRSAMTPRGGAQRKPPRTRMPHPPHDPPSAAARIARRRKVDRAPASRRGGICHAAIYLLELLGEPPSGSFPIHRRLPGVLYSLSWVSTNIGEGHRLPWSAASPPVADVIGAKSRVFCVAHRGAMPHGTRTQVPFDGAAETRRAAPRRERSADGTVRPSKTPICYINVTKMVVPGGRVCYND
jgi:hypothetical protein